MKKLIIPILTLLPLLFTNCGSEKAEDKSDIVDVADSSGVQIDNEKVINNEVQEKDKKFSKIKESVYTYLFDKHVAPVNGGLHTYTLSFDESNNSFEFKFNITLTETIDMEKEINGSLDYVEEDVDVVDELVVNGNWSIADEENNVAVVSISGERNFIDNYYNVYGDLGRTNIKKEYSDEISIDFGVATDTDFFGSEKYLKVSTEKIDESDLIGMSKDEMAYLRNEIFARKGHTFSSEKMKTYFAKQPWYRAYNEDASKALNSIEKANAEFIKSVEKAQ